MAIVFWYPLIEKSDGGWCSGSLPYHLYMFLIKSCSLVPRFSKVNRVYVNKHTWVWYLSSGRNYRERLLIAVKSILTANMLFNEKHIVFFGTLSEVQWSDLPQSLHLLVNIYEIDNETYLADILISIQNNYSTSHHLIESRNGNDISHGEMWSDLTSHLRKQWGKGVSLTWNSIDFPQNRIENQRKCEKSIQQWDVWIAWIVA